MIHDFPDLPYAYDALEPHIDSKTMEVHYSKHHKTYFDKFVAAVKDTDLATTPLTDIFASMSEYAPLIRNNGGGYYNHILFWECMSPNGGGEPVGTVGKAIEETFGGFEAFKEEFTQAGINTFGSGFAWLIVVDGKLKIVSTPNQDNPLMDVAPVKGTPILALDVWEHAYYISYQNRRPDYIDAWWNVVNWAKVEENYQQVVGG